MLNQLPLFLCGTVLVFGQLYEKPVYDINRVEVYFKEFVSKYDKQYASEVEKLKRLEIFTQNLREIISKNEESQHSVYDINKFADLTKEEFKNKYTGLRSTDDREWEKFCDQQQNVNVNNNDLPENFDWRDKNIVGPVKDQSNCLSCWAFAAIANMETQYAKQTNKLISLSEQEVLDCDANPAYGCHGGYAESAFRTVINRGGIESEESYPYVVAQRECAFNESKVVLKIKNCVTYSLADEEKLKQLLYKNGPVTIGVASGPLSYHQKGVMDPKFCLTDEPVDHAVLLVGYGIEKVHNVPFWTIRNSGGPEVGEHGYWRIPRGINCLKIMTYPASTAVL